jgi:hypothetical protein
MKFSSYITNTQVIDRAGKMLQIMRQFIIDVVDRFNKNQFGKITLADDGELQLEDYAGYGFCMIGDAQEYANFVFDSSATVTLLTDVSANVVNIDADANLCIYNNGGTVYIKNRLGSSLDLMYEIHYLI